MQFAIALVVIVGVILLAGVVLALRAARENRGERERAVQPDDPSSSVAYDVPEGQDPGAVLAALEAEGFDAMLKEHRIFVGCPAGDDGQRERVRTTIEAAPLNFEGDPSPGHVVRFVDEADDRER